MYAFLKPGGKEVATSAEFLTQPFSRGLINGYLTMDTLAALVFSLIVVNAIRLRGVSGRAEITKYTVAAALTVGAIVFHKSIKLC
ncbi:hypothetical protein GAG18_12195 [Salmonella enterica]|nr:hypothetical protein [Salmonella enterica]EBH9977621.1 hypothetical protein [Salmonella enterica subsp. arizonae serovar 40:z36:-]EAX0033825.1 hypothetical protein [Salmonella enterica]EBA5085624.1 hypothetical protein [Salmonella enterica]EDC3687465.1 hypothetical protein [Salmonella enterica]